MVTLDKSNLYSFEEYLNYNCDENRYELVDGELVLMNTPTFRHILIAKFIEKQLDKEINLLQLSWLCLREAGIRTGWRKSRIADVCVVEKEEVINSLDKSGVCETPPILVIEIVSPESVKRDYRYKRSEYATLGVDEYWIVDPIDREVTIFILNEGLYEETIFTKNQDLVSPTFKEIKLNPQQIFKTESI